MNLQQFLKNLFENYEIIIRQWDALDIHNTHFTQITLQNKIKDEEEKK